MQTTQNSTMPIRPIPVPSKIRNNPLTPSNIKKNNPPKKTNYPHIHTYNKRYVDDIVERQSREEPANGERPEGRGRGSGDRGQQSTSGTEYQGRYPALMIGYPSEEESAGDTATVEDRLGRGYEVATLAYPI